MQVQSATPLSQTSRQARANDGVLVPFARSLADTFQENGVADAGFEKVLGTMDRMAKTHVTLEKVAFLKDLVGTNRWSTGTFVHVAKALDDVERFRPSLPGQGTPPDPRPASLEMLDRLTSPPRKTFTTTADLEGLGYSPRVARQLLESQPAVVRDLELWADVEPAKARPKELYRAMALPGGLAGYDPNRVGNVNDEMYFAGRERDALLFGRDRLKLPGTEGVLLHCQVPAFMVETSPPQGGDAVWPILRARNLPDPQRPDVMPYVTRTGSFGAESQAVDWHVA